MRRPCKPSGVPRARLLAADEPLADAMLTTGLLSEPTYAAACRLLDRLQVAVARPVFRREAIAFPDTLDPVASLAAVLAGQIRVYFDGNLGLNYLRLAYGGLGTVKTLLPEPGGTKYSFSSAEGGDMREVKNLQALGGCWFGVTIMSLLPFETLVLQWRNLS